MKIHEKLNKEEEKISKNAGEEISGKN